MSQGRSNCYFLCIYIPLLKRELCKDTIHRPGLLTGCRHRNTSLFHHFRVPIIHAHAWTYCRNRDSHPSDEKCCPPSPPSHKCGFFVYPPLLPTIGNSPFFSVGSPWPLVSVAIFHDFVVLSNSFWPLRFCLFFAGCLFFFVQQCRFFCGPLASWFLSPSFF